MKPKNQGHQNKQSGLTLDPKDLQGRLRFTGHHDRRHHGAHRRGQHRDVGAWEACTDPWGQAAATTRAPGSRPTPPPGAFLRIATGSPVALVPRWRQSYPNNWLVIS